MACLKGGEAEYQWNGRCGVGQYLIKMVLAAQRSLAFVTALGVELTNNRPIRRRLHTPEGETSVQTAGFRLNSMVVRSYLLHEFTLGAVSQHQFSAKR